MNYILLTVFLPQILAQYVADLAMKPDVTFGDHNDRFDLTSFVEQQSSFLDRGASDEEYRRQANSPKIVKVGRRTDPNGEFAYHDQMDSGEGGTLAEFEENLNRFRQTRRAHKLIDFLHGGNSYRRTNVVSNRDAVKEILMHYAVPVEMTVNGYLQPPLVE